MAPPDLPTALRDTLIAVATAMAPARDPWWVLSSAAAALHGASPIEVADVDVLLSIEDAHRILPRLGLAVAPGTATDHFRSDIFATWSAPPLAVDFMAGFYARDRQVWAPVSPGSRLQVIIDSAALHIPSREELHALFRRFGRPKDIVRASLLAALPATDSEQAHLRDDR